MENEPKTARRVTMALRSDLNDRVFKKAEELGQNANYFVNQCIEGILDAMDADDISHDIPVLKLDRIMKGKTMLDSKWVNALCAFIVPNVDVEEVTVWQRRFFAELINKHEGKLTHEFINLYWKQAAERNRQRIEEEKEVARLRKTKGGAK
jgi:hypothetical protein